jgi:hypothetical protein
VAAPLTPPRTKFILWPRFKEPNLSPAAHIMRNEPTGQAWSLVYATAAGSVEMRI